MSDLHNSSLETLRKSSRARPTKGGKRTCAHCEALRGKSSPYCDTHRNEYFRGYRARKSREVRELNDELNALRQKMRGE
jgi:hypothetical protein